jgi:predicted acetyltransferase
MSLSIRPISDSEVEQAEHLIAQAFNDQRPLTELVERARRTLQPQWTLAAFDVGVMTSLTRMIPAQMRINGGSLSFAAVSPVANSPFHRRQGHTGQLLRQSLAYMREQGQVLSGLYTPHPAFYRRYGWEIAGDHRRYEFKPKDLRLTAKSRQRGRLRPVAPEAWLELDAIYQRATLRSTGPFLRGEFWWKDWLLSIEQRRLEAVLWEDSQGQPQGYMVFNAGNTPEGWASRVNGIELVAETGDAYLNLLGYLASMDIFREVTLNAPSVDLLPLLFDDGERLEISQRFTVMLRVIDLKAALEARPAAEPTLDVAFTIQVQDKAAPWNDGTWRIVSKRGETHLEGTDAPAGLTLEARVLGPLLSGYLSPSAAARAGLLHVEDVTSLVPADAFFRTLEPPHFTDSY